MAAKLAVYPVRRKCKKVIHGKKRKTMKEQKKYKKAGFTGKGSFYINFFKKNNKRKKEERIGRSFPTLTRFLNNYSVTMTTMFTV